MNNLQHLFETDLAFASIVDETAAAAIGSTNFDFAHEWLKMPYEPADDANDALAAKNDVSGADVDANDAEADTREKLERDIDRFLGSSTGWSISNKVLKEAILGWLDRQAAITELEWRNGKTRIFGMTFDEVRNLQAQVFRLKVERDNLADDLLMCNREREHLRMQLGIALDHAHDMLALVDLDGEVVG